MIVKDIKSVLVTLTQCHIKLDNWNNLTPNVEVHFMNESNKNAHEAGIQIRNLCLIVVTAFGTMTVHPLSSSFCYKQLFFFSFPCTTKSINGGYFKGYYYQCLIHSH